MSGAVASIRQLQVALALLPAGSVARASKSWEPSARPYSRAGLEHHLQDPPSRRHSQLTPGSGAAKPNAASRSRTSPEGPLATTGAGGTRSTVQRNSAGLGSALPAASSARTRSTWSPSVRPDNVVGDVQGAHEPASSRHSKRAPASGLENDSVAVVAFVMAGGPAPA